MKGIERRKESSSKRKLTVVFNIIQAVSLSVFLVMGMILTVAAGKYGAGKSGVQAEIKSRIRAMNKGAAIYAKLALNENAYKDVVFESRLGAISKLKKEYVNNSNSNYMFIFEPDCVDRDIKSGDNGSEMIGNGNYKVSTEGKGCYFDNVNNTSFRFNKKKLYNDAVKQYLSGTGYIGNKEKTAFSILKKIYPYQRMNLDFYSTEGEMVCSVTFDETYAERKIKELSSKKIDGIKVDRQRFLWEEATFSFDVDSSRVSPFTGEFRKGVLETCDGAELLKGNVMIAVHSFEEQGDNCYVNTTQYLKREYNYTITGMLSNKLSSNDDFYYLCWYESHEKSLTIMTYTSGILLIISTIAIAVMAKSSRNESGKVKRIYRIPTDIVIVLIGIVMSMMLFVLANICKRDIKQLIRYGFTNLITAGILTGVVAGIFITIFYTSFCAQIKDRAVINNMFIKKLFTRVAKNIKSLLTMVKTSILVFTVYWAAGVIECILAVFGGSEAAFFTVIIAKILGTVIIARVLRDVSKLHAGIKQMAEGDVKGKIKTENMLAPIRKEAENLNNIGEGMKKAVDARIKSERMRTELITNVSHDIKTPVTAIISYVDLLKKEDLKNQNAAGYVEVLDRQSQRLKSLIYDLLDLSKASTGNVEVNMSELDLPVFIEQSLGEYIPKMEKRNLKPVVNFKIDDRDKNELKVMADGRHLSRVFDNIFQNICKYAMENTRVYIDVELILGKAEDSSTYEAKNRVCISVKNMSEQSLNISGEELTERFVRGDVSRNTEGSGLGLSIAQSLMKLQNGNLDVIIDGDLFKIILTLDEAVSDL